MSQELTLERTIDRLESAMTQLPRAVMPLVHTFTPGLYTRQITMPAGSLVVSLTHKTEHPFIISKGMVSVWTENNGVKLLVAPYQGVTKPGTRRILYVHEDCVWTTFHPTTMTDPDKIVAEVTEPHEIKSVEDCDSNIVRKLLSGGAL